MGILNRTKQKSTGAGTGQSSFVGTELHTNPPPDVTLKRLEARYARVCQSIESGKHEAGSSKELEMSQIKKRLEMQIALQKGDY